MRAHPSATIISGHPLNIVTNGRECTPDFLARPNRRVLLRLLRKEVGKKVLALSEGVLHLATHKQGVS